jgi:hypothetical protein
MLEKLPDLIGHALRDQRAGLDKTPFHAVDLRGGMARAERRSLAFADHAPIPERYTADGEGVSPPLQWTGVPEAAASVLLIVEDADSPTPQPLVHAIVVALPAGDGALQEAALPSRDHDGARASRSAATRICRRRGCRPIRRPGTACIATRSRCSRSRPARRSTASPARGGARGDPRPRPGERLPDRHLRAADTSIRVGDDERRAGEPGRRPLAAGLSRRGLAAAAGWSNRSSTPSRRASSIVSRRRLVAVPPGAEKPPSSPLGGDDPVARAR